jgi:signal transduction histidine kinase
VEWLDAELTERRERHLLRTLRPVGTAGSGRVWINGREYINLSSNDYLGLAGHPRLLKESVTAAEKYGTSSSASRLMSGDLHIHHLLEERITDLVGKEKSLLFGSGYLANTGCVSAVCSRKDVVFLDRLCHASIVDGVLLSGARFFRFQHNDPGHLEALLKRERDKVKESMQKLVEMQERLVRSERFAAIGEAASYLSHEIKNPLMVIGGLASQVERAISTHHAECRKLVIIRDEIKRLESMLMDVRDFTRPSKPQKELLDMNSAIEKTLALMENDLTARGINYEKLLDRRLPLVFFDPEQIKQVLINLTKNAVEAMPDGGRLVISSCLENEHVMVSIADSGIGMSPEATRKMFDPFFTTKKRGTGLGLAVSCKIMEDHEGEISVQSKEGKGTTVTVLLPINTGPNQDAQLE